MASTEQCLFRLHVRCTPQEREEALSLSLRRQLGKGSKVLSWIAMLAILGFLLTSFYFAVAPAHRPYVFAAFILVWIFAFVQQRRKRTDGDAAQIEVFADVIRIGSGPAASVIRWPAFSEYFESPNLFVLLDRPKTTMLILPKRVFPDAAAIEWFRQRIEHAATEAPQVGQRQHQLAAPGNLSSAASSADALRLEFRYRYRDFLDRARSTWFGRGVILFGAGLGIGPFIYIMLNPAPDTAAPLTHTMLFFGPFAILMASVAFFTAATSEWLNARLNLVTMVIAVDERGLTVETADVTAPSGWEVYNKHKETRWSFLLWQGIGHHWLLLPKRSFPSAHSIERCRRILTSKTKRSTPLL